MQFSKWIKSLQKDVECTFGIMKGRFRILKTGIPLHGIDVCDRVWLTCCALHNFLLQEDGLDKTWGALQYLFGEGEHDKEDTRRFLHPSRGNAFDMSGVGVGSDVVARGRSIREPLWEEDEEASGQEGGGAIPVHTLPRDVFKKKLIAHFDILWKKNEIKWPSRTGSKPPALVLEHLKH